MKQLSPGEGAEFVAIAMSTPATYAWLDGGPAETSSSSVGNKRYCLLSDCVCPDGSLPFDGGFTGIGPGKSLAVAVSGTGSGPSLLKYSALSKEEVCRPCPGEEGGTGGGSGGGAGLRSGRGVHLQPTRDCPDPCVQGKWNLDTGDLAAQFDSVQPGGSTHVDGSVVLELDTGRSTVTYADDIVHRRDMGGGLTLTMHFANTGQATGTYTAVAGTLTASEESNNVVNNVTGDINGRPYAAPPTAFAAGGSVFGGTATYTCLGGEMVTQSPGTPFHHTWHRINSPG